MGSIVFIIGMLVTAAGTMHMLFFMTMIAIRSMHVIMIVIMIVMIVAMIAVRPMHMMMTMVVRRTKERRRIPAPGAGRQRGRALEHALDAFHIIVHALDVP